LRLLKEINRFQPNDLRLPFYGVSGKTYNINTKISLSDFKTWDQLSHAKQWLIFQNLGKRLSIDETSFSNGELYTILTNKAGKGKKGTIVAMIAGTKADTVTAIIEKSLSKRAIKSQRLPRHGCKYGTNC
jgi:hypothetical protein